jgi:hypothetical protein
MLNRPRNRGNSNGLDANEMREIGIAIGDPSVPLRATMVYSDFPGEDLVVNGGVKTDHVAAQKCTTLAG